MKIGYIQNAPVFGNKQKNFKEILTLVKDAKADLLVLPELFATGYAFTSKEEVREFAETIDGETAQFLKELSVKTGAIVVAGFIEKDNNEIFNSSMIIFKNKVIDTYRKIHLFNKETLWFLPGDKPFKVYDINEHKIGVMICFDWMFPEAARTLGLLGAEIIAHPSNLVLPYCQSAMITRCLENRVFAVTANRVGQEIRGGDNFTFTGGSQITAIDGTVLASAPKDTSSLMIIEIDPLQAHNKMINHYNDLLKDRRSGFYG